MGFWIALSFLGLSMVFCVVQQVRLRRMADRLMRAERGCEGAVPPQIARMRERMRATGDAGRENFGLRKSPPQGASHGGDLWAGD